MLDGQAPQDDITVYLIRETFGFFLSTPAFPPRSHTFFHCLFNYDTAEVP